MSKNPSKNIIHNAEQSSVFLIFQCPTPIDWGLGTSDWDIFANAQSPVPNPQSPCTLLSNQKYPHQPKQLPLAG